ncbi:hypothetical protein IWW37_002682 [Coemansia sp. RSA 2050]|nr:hypothetical protein IWW37_002682 [Coemansia sp. RSA 2050]
MTNLKRSLVSLFFAVGLASAAVNPIVANQHDTASPVVQHAPGIVSQVPSFYPPAKAINHAAVSATPVPGIFVAPTHIANSPTYSIPAYARPSGRLQQKLAGYTPAHVQINESIHPGSNAPAIIKSAQRASKVIPNGVDTAADMAVDTEVMRVDVGVAASAATIAATIAVAHAAVTTRNHAATTVDVAADVAVAARADMADMVAMAGTNS